jgi:hypothetical protein
MTTITLEVPDELAARLRPLRSRLTSFVQESSCASPSCHPADEMLNFLVSRPDPADILTFKSSPIAQARLEELLDKNREHGLSETEQLELDRYRQMNPFGLIAISRRPAMLICLISEAAKKIRAVRTRSAT